MDPNRYPVEEYFQRIRVDAPHVSPDGRMLVYLSFATGAPQWWIAAWPRPGYLLEYPKPLTTDADHRPNPLAPQLCWFPDSVRLAWVGDHQGDEEARIRIVDLESGVDTDVPHEKGTRDYLGFVAKDDGWLYFTSNRERRDVQSLMRYDPEEGLLETIYTHERLSAQWAPHKVWRGRLLFTVAESILLNSLHAVDPETSEVVDLSPPGDYAVAPIEVLDDERILVATNYGRQFTGLAVLHVDDMRYEYLFPETWDQRGKLSPRRDLLYVVENRAGIDSLTVHRWPSLRRVDFRVPRRGILGDIDFDDRGRHAVLTFQSPVDPTEIVALSARNRDYALITDNYTSRVPRESLSHPRVVHYRSTDGQRIWAMLFLPRGARQDARLPAVVWPHGGPQWQERAQQRPLFQYLLSRGIAIFAHNPRGSTGFGRGFAEAIERAWGVADLPDLEAGVAWLKRSGWVDPERIGIMGGSYGGYMTLRAITKLPDLFKVAVDIFGVSNLFSFVKSVPEDWAPYMDREVGHPERDADILREASPIFALDRIRCPLMVVQGARDPRVVKAESDQVVDALRGRGVDVEYLVFEDEGHGFFRRENEMKFCRLVADFLEPRL